MSNAVLDRELGDGEKLFNWINVTVVLIADVTGAVRLKTLQKAALHLAQRHPTLRVDTDAKRQHFVQLSREQVQKGLSVKHVNTNDTNKWKELAEEYCNTPIVKSEGKPLWHVTFITCGQSKKIILAYDHSIADGMSGRIMLRDLLQFCDNIESFDASIDDVEPLPMLENLTKLTYPIITEQDTLLAKEKAEQMRKERLENIPLLPFDVLDCPRRNRALFYHGSNFQKIKKIVKEKGLTVGNVIMASTFLEIANEYFATNSEQRIPVHVDIDVNMRDRITPKLGDDHAMLLMEMIPVRLEIVRNMDFWTLCTLVNQLVSQKLEQKEPHLTVLANEHLPNDQEYDEHLTKNHERMGDVNVSNMGYFEHQQVGSFTVNSLFTLSTNCPVGWSFMLFVHCVENLCYVLEYDESLLTEEHANRIGENIIRRVEQCYETN
jgi:Na+-translocating ferredoxin:NAD+ oxidoreductase RnfG subunit